MATDQGKTSNLNAIVAVAAQIGADPAAVGTTTFRPPYTPVTFGAFAGPHRGDLFAPIRMPPIFSAEAVPEDAGGLETRALLSSQRRNDRGGDGARMPRRPQRCRHRRRQHTWARSKSIGPDAAVFLNRIYTGDFTTLEPGQCRYALLLGEDGFVRDDGIVARLAADRFHVTTTTGGAAFVLHHMEDYLQTEFAGLRVWLTSVTEQWAVIAVQGPRSAEALAPFISDIDLGAMPRMSVREGHIGEIPIRLFRTSGLRGRRGSRSTCRRTRRNACGTRCGSRASRRTAPMRCMCCARRRALSSSARKPTAPSRRTISASAGRSAATRAISSASVRCPCPN